jgi:hypothetical protein
MGIVGSLGEGKADSWQGRRHDFLALFYSEIMQKLGAGTFFLPPNPEPQQPTN